MGTACESASLVMLPLDFRAMTVWLMVFFSVCSVLVMQSHHLMRLGNATAPPTVNCVFVGQKRRDRGKDSKCLAKQ